MPWARAICRRRIRTIKKDNYLLLNNFPAVAFGGDDEGVKARRRDVNESGVVNKSRDMINNDAPSMFLHKILIIFTRFGEQKGAVEYFKIYGDFFRIFRALIVAPE